MNAEPVMEGAGACGDNNGAYICNRPAGHQGDHLFSQPYASWLNVHKRSDVFGRTERST